MKRGIAVRIAVIFSGLLLLATSTAGYMVHHEARSSLTKSSTERLAHTAEVIRVRTLASVEAITKDVRFLASTPPVQGIVRARVKRGLDPETALLDSEWRKQLVDVFEVFLENRSSFVEVSFTDLRGTPKMLVSVGRNQDDADRQLRATQTRLANIFPSDTALARGYVYLSDVELEGEVKGAPNVPIVHAAIPVFEKEGKLFGAVMVGIDLRDLLESLTTIVGTDKSLFIANANGRLLTSPKGPYAIEGHAASIPLGIHDIFATRETHSENVHSVEPRKDYGGASAAGIAYFNQLPYDALNQERLFKLAVVSPNAVILDAVNDVEKRSVLIVLFFSVGGVLIALGLSRFLTRPLSDITDALAHFGEEGWDIDLPTARPDEIGVLSRAFDKMASHIRYQLGVLEDKERHQRIILETAAEGIIVADRHGIIENFNCAASRLFGYSAEEVLGKHINLLLPPYDHNWTAESSDAVLSWRDVGTGHDVMGRRKDGSEIQISLSVSEFVFEKQSKYTLFLEDITERKEYERALCEAKEKAEEMAQLKSAFLANMSHELRTPLTAVIGYASMLADELSEDQEHHAQVIERSGRRLMDTLNAVLSLAQLESHQMTVDLDELNVAREVEEAAQFFDQHAAEKGLALRYSCSPSARGALARLDRGALNSVLQNIVGNAIKFTDSGSVEMNVRANLGAVEIEIKDTGIGIDHGFLPHLFDAFRQESVGLQRSHEGSGLGLALTKRLIDLMDGQIAVESVKQEGSTFTVSFPHIGTEDIHASGAPDPGIEKSHPDWNEAQILVVEDNPETAFLLQRVLSVAGDVTLAFEGAEAIRKSDRVQYDLVLCDINLGSGTSGVDVLNELRTDPCYKHVPIVALTAHALPGDRERYLKTGFTEYLSKPFTPDALLHCVYDMLHRQGGNAKQRRFNIHRLYHA